MSRDDLMVRSLTEAIQNHGHLYSEEEIRFMKTQLRTIAESRQQLLKEEKNGFRSKILLVL